MAGVPILFDPELPSKPETIRIAQATGLDPLICAMKCLQLWAWMKPHTTGEGLLPHLTLEAIAAARSDLSALFLRSMVEVGWLSESAGGVLINHFDYWLGPQPRKAGKKKPAGKGKKAEKFDPLGVALPGVLDCDEFRAAWRSWVEFRRERKPALTGISVKRQLKQLSTWGLAPAVASIEQSIANGYQGLFLPKESAGGHGRDVRRNTRVGSEAGEYAGIDDSWLFAPEAPQGAQPVSPPAAPAAD